jgi:glycosyltransferase involved in cell wall biosynthesis
VDQTPNVSIIVCNYNHAKYLETALVSACEQTYPCEVILVDDGSTDDSLTVAARWSDKIKILAKSNEGQRSAYNAGFEACSGEFVVFLDADDWLRRTAVETALEHFTGATARVHFQLQLSDERGDDAGGVIPTKMATGNVADSILQHGVLPPSAPASGNVYRRSVLQQLMPLPLSSNDKNGADFFTIYGSSLLGAVVAVRHTLGHYRVVSSSHASEDAFVLGNAARRQQRSLVLRERYQLFEQWILARANIRLSHPLNDFSELKVAFAQNVFEKTYAEGLWQASRQLPTMGRVLLYHPNYSRSEKCVFAAWALLTLVAPRALMRKVSSRVTNPKQRPRGRQVRSPETK